MPKSPAKGTSKPLPNSTQFSISSFLPKAFNLPATSPSPASTSTASRRTSDAKPKKRKVEADDVLSDEGEEEFKMPALPVKKKGKAALVKRKETEVLDLTSDDDGQPSVPVRSSKAKDVKGKGKAKIVEEKKPTLPSKDALKGEMWAEQYAPQDRDDIALHPRKLLDVQTWLCEAFALPLPEAKTAASKKSTAAPKPPPPINPKLAKYRRVLVLSGAAGSAKTAALDVLCREMDVQVVEWTEGMRDEFGGDGETRESLVHRFSSFLARAGMTPALDFGDFEESDDPSPSSSTSFSSNPSPSSTASPIDSPPPHNRRLILLEDLPNVSHFPTKLALRSAIAQYLASPRVTCPLVVIISEALARPGTDDGGGMALSGGGGRGDSYDARSVLGIEILQNPACREIPFNPIAATIMRKALQRTLDRIYEPFPSTSRSRTKSSSSRTTVSGLDPSTRPSISTLDLLIQHSNGDIRSALMSLQFLAMQGGDATSLGLGGKAGGGGAKKGKGKKRKRGSDSEEDSEEEARQTMGGKDKVKQLLQSVTSRESSLFIFHALGKVLYNKRWGDTVEDDKKDLNRPGILQDREYEKLPKHLRKSGIGRRASKVDPDVLFAEAPLDPDIFLSYLHHNYPPFTNDIEECVGILEGLSTGDAMMLPKGSGAGEGEDAHRRSALTANYAFHLSTRSTLLSLPSPVPRRKQVLRKSELWQTVRLARQNEEGVAELLGLAGGQSSLNLSGTAGLVYAGCQREEEEEGGLVTRREGGSLLSEVVPWLGVIKPENANAFLLDLATFPPLDASQAGVTGDALGEKDLESDEDDGTAADTQLDSNLPTPSSTLSRSRVLEEVEEEQPPEDLEEREKGVETAVLFDEEDDIED